MRYTAHTLFLLVTLISTGCTTLFTAAYGIKEAKPVDEKTIVKYAKKYHIPIADAYQIDSTYLYFLSSFDTAHFQEAIQNHYQPLQALYYDKSGKLISFQVNCYAGGFPNLNWERNNAMKTFPPKIQAPLDTIVPLRKHLTYLLPLTTTTPFSLNDYDIVTIVHWNRLMGRQSKRLIKLVQTNSKLAKQRVKVVYVNTDNLHVD